MGSGVLSVDMCGGRTAGSSLERHSHGLQLCTATPCVHAQHRPVAASRNALELWAAAPSRALPAAQRLSGAEQHVCKTSSSSSDLLFVLALLPVARPSTSRRMVMSVHAISMHLCGCAMASPHAVWHSRTGHHVPASSSQSGRAVPPVRH